MIQTLETPRLRLVPPSQACAKAYELFYTDAEASRMYGGPITAAAAWTRLSSDLGSWYLQGFGVWAMQEKSDGEFLGTCGFWQGRDWPRELTWWLLPQYRGHGFAKEASLAAVHHAYEVLGWSAVETYMNDQNTQARALVLSLGGQKARRQGFPDGKERDVFIIPRTAV
ncbi:GNAT family N-acetyltransferase [Rhodoferax sp. U11-2br]|nr:GNAT family N-acetyltransferase [Rhodoferax sp. U11-2br]